ncbi:MAG: iron-sulfur cluster assembly protein [candidate division Zixibacteria bacterium]|nr:iron-sulfur cluster assembly protein [candidate division Zixibacteria bacterium]MDD5427040.1 iron-sulfur cluster assembly protein [candidate division Zixibacteria bacterium]
MAVPTKQQIIEALKPVQDPEIRIGIVDLGLIYDIDVDELGEVKVKMTLTTPACPYGDLLVSMTKKIVSRMEGVKKVDIVLVWDPPWDPREMASDLAKDQLGLW